MIKKIIKHKNIASSVAAIMLLLAIPSGLWPYGYYIFLRWAVTGSALFVLWTAHSLKKNIWVYIMGAITLLFNPIAPIHLSKSTWAVIDSITAIIFILSIAVVNAHNDEGRSKNYTI